MLYWMLEAVTGDDHSTEVRKIDQAVEHFASVTNTESPQYEMVAFTCGPVPAFQSPANRRMSCTGIRLTRPEVRYSRNIQLLAQPVEKYRANCIWLWSHWSSMMLLVGFLPRLVLTSEQYRPPTANPICGVRLCTLCRGVTCIKTNRWSDSTFVNQ